jgi:hypothetical protein
MSHELEASIHFYFDKRHIATRLWYHVPRIGEEVLINNNTYHVKSVVWGVDAKEIPYQAVNIEVVERESNK